MKILWLTAYSPWPPIGGGRIRVHNLVHGTVRLGHQVQVWCIASQAPEGSVPTTPGLSMRWFKARSTTSAAQRARALLTSLPIGAWKARSDEVLRAIDRLRGSDFDVIVVEQMDLGALLPELLRTGIPIVLDAQNVESWLSWQMAITGIGGPTGRLRHMSDSIKYRRLEKRLLRSVAAVVTMSEKDRNRLQSSNSTCPIIVHQNGVDLNYFNWLDHTRVTGDRLIFVGLLDFAPNFDACVWLRQSIMPAVRRRIPTATITIVGAASGKVWQKIQQLNDPARGFCVIGPVDDVRPYLEAADLFIIPLRAGSGTRLKALEALASGLPVVGTQVGLEGLGLVEDRLAFVGSTVSELTEAVSVALLDSRSRRDMSRRGRPYIESHFDWREIGSAFEQTLVKIAISRREARSRFSAQTPAGLG